MRNFLFGDNIVYKFENLLKVHIYVPQSFDNTSVLSPALAEGNMTNIY